MKYHPLTEKVLTCDTDMVDQEIRSFLKDIAEKLNNDYWAFPSNPEQRDTMLRKILGLEECEHPTLAWCDEFKNPNKIPAPTEDKKEWCEHMMPGKVISVPGGHASSMYEWQFCPICGTPRPSPKTLEQKFKEVIHSHSTACFKWIEDEHRCILYKELANIATDYFTKGGR